MRGDDAAATIVCAEACPQRIPTAVAEPVPESNPNTVAEIIEAFPEQGDYKQEVAAPAKEVPAATEIPAPSQGVRAPDDSVVRVSAGNLNRLMALAGESLVESGRLGEFASSLYVLKAGTGI